ncbi:M15 family metallopeptidase [Herminiimonas glaciei]|uniref:M15 family metallopeptidase n=1 Tax=Herminiimonas glaciei TaxID=523788 RepID=A0ABW2IC75_9BURK
MKQLVHSIPEPHHAYMTPFPLLHRYIATVLLCAAVTAHAGSAISEVSDTACNKMRRQGVLQKNAPVTCAQLRIVQFSYLDFDGKLRNDGEIMVLAAVAEHVQAIFDTLLQRKFPIARARLMDHYRGDDAASMRDNNTSAFNDRRITNGKAASLHAYGVAIDINPVQNPFLQFEADGKAIYSPPTGSKYANRLTVRPGKATRQGMAEEVVEVFAQHGFLGWGGNWDAPIDYQHFQVNRALAERMVALPVPEARKAFNAYVERYRSCVQTRKETDRTVAQATCATSVERSGQ